ncbi:MAG TPA: anaerobic carbon-monoxide dehydrogenase catalytic subunit [Methylomusa anaerophila]|uniref:Carbon monoxide dehydrogenase n=1 Tax=Methylomusa anaerophila TaxID=1930071 RepID=A0A348ALV1_9FIRM|nr:anaerobic carbon-monoxide dehydrogenase catalytic subunit [Methylomusa anaerophila]BBB92049.1 carbon monoxide dehydrogenase 2 [Methylomusa anaerophila]HML87939.1 anaerobic carbon-monoxide dehydrogenase catalytic subunit [Methylomusa anaerophila]
MEAMKAKKAVKATDCAVGEMLEVARKQGIETVWDRYARQIPQCGFGDSGLCCRNCTQGPCRIDPFGDGPAAGVCGITADSMVARNLIRAIAAGAASHSGHAKHLAHVLKKVAAGKLTDYSVKDENKLRAVATRLGIPTEGKSVQELAAAVASAALEEFSEREEPLAWAATTLTSSQVEKLGGLGVLPAGIDSAISEILQRTTLGVDADPVNLLLGGVKGAVADFAGCHLGTDLADILFGTPTPVFSEANMGVLKENAVNIALHGHNPVVSELIVVAARQEDILAQAKSAGAEGINLVGICCTGNEVLMRQGVAPLTHSLSQEMPILTGALDAIVVDYQCVYPSLANIADCYGTKLITTMDIAKIPGAVHMAIEEERGLEQAKEIIKLAVERFKARKGAPTCIPQVKQKVIAGFSTEAIIGALSKLNAADPLKPLIDNIVNGNIQGVVLFAGCNNVKVPQDANFIAIVKELAKRDVLMLATGCGAGALARHGLLTSEATMEYAGPGLKAVFTAIGEANGLGGPLPLVLHVGSCVDNSRPVDIAVALANKLGVDVNQLPVAASAPEFKAEKAVAIGTWAVTLGLPTHLGLVPPVLGSKLVTRVLTQDIKDITGGYFLVETDPLLAAEKIFDALQERRQKLNIGTRRW